MTEQTTTPPPAFTPPSIKIGPIRFAVEEIHGLIDADGITKLNGNILLTKCRMHIEQDMDNQNKYICIWHEIVHGILAMSNLEQNEQAVEILANGIVSALQDNPWLIEHGRDT